MRGTVPHTTKNRHIDHPFNNSMSRTLTRNHCSDNHPHLRVITIHDQMYPHLAVLFVASRVCVRPHHLAATCIRPVAILIIAATRVCTCDHLIFAATFISYVTATNVAESLTGSAPDSPADTVRDFLPLVVDS